MLKRVIAASAIVLSMFSTAVYANSDISVIIDGGKVEFSDAEPMIAEDRTLVPLRGVFENLGALVSWEEESKTAYITYKLTNVEIKLGAEKMIVSGALNTEYELDVAARIVDDRMMIPLRAVSEALACRVDWDNETRSVSISRVHDGVIDYVRTEEAELESGNKLEIVIFGAKFKADGEVEKQINTLIENFCDNLIGTRGSEFVSAGYFTGTENLLEYVVEAIYTEDGDLCLVEFLGTGVDDEFDAHMYTGAVFDAQSGELKDYTDFLAEYEQ